jgi:hypothetical protein
MNLHHLHQGLQRIARRENPAPAGQRPVEVVRITYNRSGVLMKVKIKPSLYAAFQKAQDRLGEYARYEFSQTIFMRRALDLYLTQLAQMSVEQLINESRSLIRAKEE